MNFDFAFYHKLFWRRLPVMALFILICAGMGAVTAVKLPETFSTSARLLVEAPQIPDSMVASTIQTDAIEQLDIIEQKLLTRANMIDIAQKFEVFEDMRDMEPDTVVKSMRQATSVRRTAGRNQATLMTISFNGRSARIVADVVNEYVTLVLAENTDFRVSRAENTLGFFNQEVQRLGEELDRQSAEIAVFRSENAEALPEDQSYRLGRQTLLQDRLARIERDLTATKKQRADIVKVYETTGRLRQRGQVQVQLSPEEQQLNAARAELDQARSVYSDTNPRIIRLQALIERLEATVAAQGPAPETSEEGEVDAEAATEKALLQAALAEIDSRIEFLESDLENTTQELEKLQEAISRSSANGIQLAALERDYEITQARHNSAVNNLNQARMSERIETTAQGQRITVIENANVPQVPAGPNRPKIAAMGLAAGLGLAGGYFMLLELLNRTVRRPAELVSRFNVTPITTIPYMESRSRRVMRRTGLIAATLFVLIAVPAALWYVDTNYIPLELVVQKGLNKLGLG